MEQGYF